MRVYGKIPYLFIYILSLYGQVFVESINETLSDTERSLKKRNRLDQYILLPPEESADETGEIENCLISCNIRKKDTNDRIEYRRDDSKKTDTFIAKSPYIFYKVKTNSRDLWEAEDKRYFSRVVVKETPSGESFFRIYFHNEGTESDLEYEYPEEKVVETIPQTVPSPALTPTEKPELTSDVIPVITIDINYKQNNKYFQFEQDDDKNREVFTTKEPYLIKKIISNDNVLWESKNGMYSFRAVYRPDPEGPKLKVFFPDGQEPLPESELKPPPVPESMPDFIPLPSDEYKSDSEAYYSHDEQERMFSSPEPKFEPVPHPKATISYMPAKKYSSEPEYEPRDRPDYRPQTLKKVQPRRPPINLPDSDSDSRSDLEFVPASRSYTDSKLPSEIIPVAVDIGFKFSTYLFNYSRCNNLAVYTPQDGFVFARVKRNDKFYCLGRDIIIWQTNDMNVYSTKLHVIADNRVVIHLNTGKTLFYKRGFDCFWERVDKTSYNPIDWNHYLLDLDISKKSSTQYYEFFGYDNYIGKFKTTYLYVARQKFRFKTVYMGRKVIWQTYNEKDLAFKVGVYRAIGGTDHVTIFMINGNKRTFFRQSYGFGFGSKWMEELIEPGLEKQRIQDFEYTSKTYAQPIPAQRTGIQLNIPTFSGQVKNKLSKWYDNINLAKLYKSKFGNLYKTYTFDENLYKQTQNIPQRKTPLEEEYERYERYNQYPNNTRRMSQSQQYYDDYPQDRYESRQRYGDYYEQRPRSRRYYDDDDYERRPGPRRAYDDETLRMARSQDQQDNYMYRAPKTRPYYPESKGGAKSQTYDYSDTETEPKHQSQYQKNRQKAEFVDFRG